MQDQPPAGSTPSDHSGVQPILELRGISRTFPGVRALSNVDFDVRPGEVHALMGENGAGKSTLMKIVSGVYQPDSGSIRFMGTPVQFAHPREAQQRGISIIHQEFNLLPERTVAQNIFLGREPGTSYRVDSRAMEDATRVLLSNLGVAHSISPRAMVGRLSVAQQQTVEIAKALSFDARIVVMDEPTASLSPTEVEGLFRTVRELQARGIAFVYVSHRLEEVMNLSQRITVLKDGEKVTTIDTAATSPGQLVSLMVGRELSSYYPPHATSGEIGEPVLAITGGSNHRLDGINLTIHRGEVVGIAGLEGAGRTELARAIFGVEPFTSGTMTLQGSAVHITSPRQAIRAGIGFLTEDRKTEGLILPQNIRNNALLAIRSLGQRVRRTLTGAEPDDVIAQARRVDLRASGLEQEVRFLSGGNQQKVVLMKWLSTGARLLIFDEPTRGIDVGAKAGIHELIRELARAGAGVLMISSELPEVIGMSDRILVMRQGRIAGELTAGPSEARILALATGEIPTEVAA
ncbi:MAG: Ribose ABC transport system, ATP-binding protein RbsA [uncultured Thermomicrobiales bacterium]|uniref:Ribose ABC transport system, ATP-binding protein RbsA n=1 Tax=uncultured Thermomicrobiales bacterium TaxID=1645740 RepID=A0A6J4UGJ9_9BACT|nr:MAG: Ribose ABC transport system, ATP-binding protein RbsA [uncultured Thermomicrobiales bacterium]